MYNMWLIFDTMQRRELCMIYLDSITNVNALEYDEVWIIVRKLKESDLIEGSKHIPELSPSTYLLERYIELREKGIWNKESFEKIYVPSFIREIRSRIGVKEILNDLVYMSGIGQKICLVCYCEDEEICHRSIVSGILAGMGANIQSNSDYLRFYDMYINEFL